MIWRITLFILIIIFSLTNLIRGYIFKYIAVKDIDNKWGHKTRLSRENINNWRYANHFSGNLYIIIGNILLFFNVMIYFTLVIHLKVNLYGLLASLILFINSFIMLLIHFITERFLKRYIRKVKNDEQ